MLVTYRRWSHVPIGLALVIGVVIIIIPGSPLGVPPVYAQSSTATLTGSAVDADGALVVGVEITVTNISTGLKRLAPTNNNGYFVIPFLPPAHYAVKAQRQGFATVEVKDVELNVNEEFALRIQLKVGAISESVVVTGSGSLIRTESAAVETVVSRQLVENLPLNGRSFQSLVALAPGVVLTKADVSNQGQFSANGQRADANYFTVDGVGANVGASEAGYDTGGTVPATSALGGTNNLVSIDALQEFSIQTSTYAAEFGRTPGAQVSVITRSGTNQFHGSLFEYFRNDALDANDWFANSQGLAKAPLRQNDFGGVFGGPIVREHTFFFFSYEGQRLRQPKYALTTVPSLALRQTAPSQMQAFLNAFPIPNGRILSSTRAQFAATYSNPLTVDATSLRLDHKITRKANIFGRYNYAPSHTVERQTPGSALNNLQTTKFQTETLTVGSTQTITAKVVNETRLNYSQNKRDAIALVDGFGGAVPPPDSALYPPFASPEDSTFIFTVDGARFIASSKASRTRQRQINVVDNLSVVKRDHQLRFGVDYRRLAPIRSVYKYLQSIGTTGTLALKGTALAVTVSSKLGDVFPLFTNFSAYGQDTWTATRRLTLTYGLRWELNPPPREKYGNDPLTTVGGFDPNQMTLAPRGTPLWKTRYTNFAPRVGAAYLLSRSPGREIVLRGGFGVFYDLGMGNAGAASSPERFPYSASKNLRNVSLPLAPALAEPPPFSLNPPWPEITSFDPNLKTPRTYEWSFGVERSLGSQQALSASYVGAAGRRLSVDQFWFNPNPNFSRLHLVRDTGTSDYDALQVQFERRLSRHLEALVAYTWGHSIDTASNDSSFLLSTDPNELRIDRGNSDFDVRHSVSAAVTYDVPALKTNKLTSALLRNWSVGAIVMVRTATPIGVTTSCNVTLSNDCPRPDLIAGVPVYSVDPSAPGGRRLNPLAFAIPPQGRQGTLGRNALPGFPVFQMDMSLRRNFKLREKLELQLTAEVFNILNHPNFGDPSADLFGDPQFDALNFGFSHQMLGQTLGTGGSAGQAGLNPIYQIGGPRDIQFAVKLKF